MTINFPELAKRAAADGQITADEVLALRRVAWPDGVIDAEEAEAILAVNDLVGDKNRDWTDFLVEAVGEYVVNGLEPKGYVAPETADWLMAHLDRDGELDSMTELELLVRVLEKALGTPETLKAYALNQIERAVVCGSGPTRGGGALGAGSITDAECKLLRRMIFASGSDRPAAVSQAEAEMLFRIKDATLAGDNAPEWQRLFVQGVGNYLQGWNNAPSLTRERAAELEMFMDDISTGLGSGLGKFFGRMTRVGRNDLNLGAQHILSGGEAPACSIDGEACAAATASLPEQQWLDDRIAADHHSDPLEHALIAFLAEAR